MADIRQPQDWNIASIIWQEHNADGTRYSLLEGTKDQHGQAFTYAFFVPAGVWDAAHYHTADARIVIIQGELALGYGDTVDIATAKNYPFGSYLLVPAYAVHYDGATATDTILIGTAVGPWEAIYVPKQS